MQRLRKYSENVLIVVLFLKIKFIIIDDDIKNSA